MGALNAVYARTLSNFNPGRQFLFFRVRYWNGLPIYSCDVISLAKWDDIGNSKMDKKDSEASELTYLPVRDESCMAVINGVYQPVKRYRIWGGKGWAALGGKPTFSATVPTATATTTGAATLAFPEPTGPADPWSYKAQQSTDAGTTWLTAVTPTNVALAGGTVTLTLSGLTAGASKLRAIATGTNGVSANSPASGSVTIT
jgi:hypothetical protein